MSTWLLILLSAAPLPLGPLTTRDGVAPVQVVDSADFICRVHPRFHLELLDLASGAKKAEPPGWTDVLGELADGALVVTNQTAPAAKKLEAAVIERTGAVRFSCAVDFNAHAFQLQWVQSPRGLEGSAWKVRAPSGIRPPMDPEAGTPHFFSLKLESRSCTLVVTQPSATGPQSVVPGSKLVAAGVLDTRSAGEFVELVAAKWRRKIAFVPVPCNLP